MKKRLIALAMCSLLLVSLVGCNYDTVQEEKTNDGKSMFTIIESAYSWKVVYHNETKVMYTVSYGSYNCGTFTLLVNADGTPMIYEK